MSGFTRAKSEERLVKSNLKVSLMKSLVVICIISVMSDFQDVTRLFLDFLYASHC